MNKFKFRGFLRLINIKDDSNKEFAISNLSGDIFIKGPNLWYLVSSAILASIGLDVNSPAVIIGAMLISPLMSPILGIGLSIGIYDKDLLIASIREYLFAVMISLFISTVYFLISPLGIINNELISRTTPTLLDIGIAFFGGIAGIVAGTRKGLVNSIPGVAIATALMPPVCTAGYGIASGNPTFFFGAIYLFFINTVFISLSAVVIVRYLKFPLKSYVNKIVKAKIRRIILFFVVIVSVPGLIIFYGIIKEAREQKHIKVFVNKYFDEGPHSVISWRLNQSDSIKTLNIFYTGNKYRPGEEDSLKQSLREEFGKIDLKIQQLDQGYQVESIEKKINNEIDLKLQSLFESNNSMQEKIKNLEKERIFNPADTIQSKKLFYELNILYPSISELTYSKDTTSDSTQTITIISSRKRNELLKPDDKSKIERYIKYKTNNDSLDVVFE